MILIQVGYIKTDVDGTVQPAKQLQFVAFDKFSCMAFLSRNPSTIGPMDTVAEQDLPNFKMITIELAQEKPWTYERHIFLVARDLVHA